MKRILSILFFLSMIVNAQSQTFCLQLTEVSNDGTTLVLSVGVQGSETFGIGSSNLQFQTAVGAFGSPSVLSSPLAPPFYFVPTITNPVPGSYSLNIELAFPDDIGTVEAAPGYTEMAQLSFPILDADLADNGIFWEYTGATTQTVMFLDDDATQLFATSLECLVGIEAIEVLGCTDESACNFDSDANEDDGSCLVPAGCDECDGEGGIANNPEVGDLCDDGLENTENDVIIACGVCEGTPIVDAPENDLCADAIAIECDATVTGSTATATSDASIESCGTSVSSAPGVWFALTGTGNEIEVNTNGSLYDTKLGVFDGACDALNCIDTDDDDGAGLQSLVTFASVEGTTYFIYVTGFSTNAGDYTLNTICGTDAIDCEELGLNIGDACDDGNAETSDMHCK